MRLDSALPPQHFWSFIASSPQNQIFRLVKRHLRLTKTLGISATFIAIRWQILDQIAHSCVAATLTTSITWPWHFLATLKFRFGYYFHSTADFLIQDRELIFKIYWKDLYKHWSQFLRLFPISPSQQNCFLWEYARLPQHAAPPLFWYSLPSQQTVFLRLKKSFWSQSHENWYLCTPGISTLNSLIGRVAFSKSTCRANGGFA